MKILMSVLSILITFNSFAENKAPIALDKHLNVLEDEAKSFNLNANDELIRKKLKFTIVNPPQHGSIAIGEYSHEITFTPKNNFNGADKFTFKVTDPYGLVSNIATVNLDIKPQNDAPIAESGSFEFYPNEFLSGLLKASDIDGDELSFHIVSQSKGGQVSFTNNRFIYERNADFLGEDSFSYVVRDGTTSSEVTNVNIKIKGRGFIKVHAKADHLFMGTEYDLEAKAKIPGEIQNAPHELFNVDPGLLNFFTASTSDGTIFAAGMSDTMNAFFRASCSMSITCFNPVAKTCYNEDTNTIENFANIRIKSSAKTTALPVEIPLEECHTLAAREAYGSDISDIATINVNGEERIFWVSAMGSNEIVGKDNWPALGQLRKAYGLAWMAAPGTQKYASDLYKEQEAEICTHTYLFGQERYTCGTLNEIAIFPKSNKAIITTYVDESVVVYDLKNHKIKAAKKLPKKVDFCDGKEIKASTRLVETDPSGVLGREKFVIVFDSHGRKSQATQEFVYNDFTKTIEELTEPFAAVGANATASCNETKQGLVSHYDDEGNLWVTTLRGYNLGVNLVYEKGADGKTQSERDCPYTGDGVNSEILAKDCFSDITFGIVNKSASDSLRWQNVQWSPNLIHDSENDIMINAGLNGAIEVYKKKKSTQGANVYTGILAASTGVASYSTGVQSMIRVSKGSFNKNTNKIWLPVGESQKLFYTDCNFFTCQWQVGHRRRNYFLEIDYPQLLTEGITTPVIQAPKSINIGEDLTVNIVINRVGIDLEFSGIYLYNNKKSAEGKKFDLTSLGCNSYQCIYQGKVPASQINPTFDNEFVWRIAAFKNSESFLATSKVKLKY